jgi:hypothetical protein
VLACTDLIKQDGEKIRLANWPGRTGNGRVEPLPADLKVLAAAEPLDVSGDDVLDPLQIFLIIGLGAQC